MTTVTTPSRWVAAFLAMLLAAALLPLAAPPADAAEVMRTDEARTADEAKAEARLFGLHNRARTDPSSFGRPDLRAVDELRWSEPLAEYARGWSDWMADAGHLGYPNWITAEGVGAVAMDFSVELTADQLMEAWMASDHEVGWIMSSATEVGIGAAIDEVNDVLWVTALYIEPDHVTGTTRYPDADARKARPCGGEAHALVGDWDGSGSDGLGWWCNGRTRLVTSSGDVHEFVYGRGGDLPVVADWNGDGRDTVSVIRDGTWHVNNELRSGESERTFIYGRVRHGDVPIAGDWDAGGRDLPGIIRDREWHLRAEQLGGVADWQFIYGRLTAGDLPLWGDWDGDGQDTVGIVRDGTWHLREEHRGGPADIKYIYGRVKAGDMPVVGNWNGDGQDTPAIVRGAEWHLKDHHSGGRADLVLSFPRP